MTSDDRFLFADEPQEDSPMIRLREVIWSDASPELAREQTPDRTQWDAVLCGAG